MRLGATVAGCRRRADIDHHAAVGAGAVGEPSTLTFSAIGRQAYLQRVHLVGLPCRTSRNDCCRRTCTVVWCSTAAAAVSRSAGSAGIQAFDGADLQAAPHRCRTRRNGGAPFPRLHAQGKEWSSAMSALTSLVRASEFGASLRIPDGLPGVDVRRYHPMEHAVVLVKSE